MRQLPSNENTDDEQKWSITQLQKIYLLESIEQSRIRQAASPKVTAPKKTSDQRKKKFRRERVRASSGRR